MHMASDITEGSRLYSGPKHREATVQEITVPFSDSADGVVLEVRAQWQDGGVADIQFTRSSIKKDQVIISVDQKFTDWGVRGHSRNKHKPPTHHTNTGEHLTPLM